MVDDDPLNAKPKIKQKVSPKLGMHASGSKRKSSTATVKETSKCKVMSKNGKIWPLFFLSEFL